MAQQTGSETTVNGETRTESTGVQLFIDLQHKLLDYYGVQATSRFVELKEPRMRMHLLEAGKGEPVVIFHGGDGEAVNWAPLMGLLQRRVHIYAVDRPGFGLSDAFDYKGVNLRTHAADVVGSLFGALHLERATLIGGSMGGFFALAGALAHPSKVSKIVLVGLAAGAISQIPASLQKITESPWLAEEFMRGRDNMEAQKTQYREMFHTDPSMVPDLFFETRIAGLRLPSEQGTWATLLPKLGEPDVYLGDNLPNIKAPTLIMWGDYEMSPVEVGQGIARQIPGAHFEHLAGVGHFPFLQVPERTAKLITDFLELP